MSKEWPDIKLFCRHGIKGGEATFVERFRHQSHSWVPTVRGWDRTQQLQGDTAITIATHQPEGGAIRHRYAVDCPECERPFRRRMEELESQLYMAARLGFDTLYLDDIT